MARTPHPTPRPLVPVLPTALPGLGQIPDLPLVENRSLPPVRPPLREEIFPQPRYADGFRCIGSTCEDNCCKAWDVRLDRATYERYQLIPVETLVGRTVQHSVAMLPEPRDERAYAHILLNEALQCPFLTEEKWCGIQQTLGEEALSPTCRTYPRIERKSPAGDVETTLHLSCPEAARLVLLHRSAEQDGSAERDGSGPDLQAAYDAVAKQSLRAMAAADAGSFDVARFAEVILGATRTFLRQLLRDRRYSLGERLWLMGVFSGRLKALLPVADSSAPRQFPVQRFLELLAEFCRLVGAGTLLPALAQVAGQPTMQLALTLRLINRRLDRAMNSLRFLDDIKAFLDGIGYQPGMTPESLAPALLRGEREIFAPWMEAHPWLLENYLVHALDRSGFPLGEDGKRPNPEGDFHALCTHFVVIRTLLIGVAATRGASFGVEDAVHLVQSYSRMVDHHAEFLTASAGLLAEAHWTDTGSMAGLLLEATRRQAHTAPNARAMA